MSSSIPATVLSTKLKRRLIDLMKLSLGGALTFCGIGIYMNNEKFYESVVMPSFHILNPESAHRLSVLFAKYKLVPAVKLNDLDMLKTFVFGLNFETPVGLAAGYDKNGEAVEGLFKMGFSFVEVGSVTPKPQVGNPKPRVFRLPEIKGIINRYGFNSDGHDVVYERLAKLDSSARRGVLGVNLGKNRDSQDPINDYVLGIKKFGHIADYLVINISSPNTPGLTKMQEKEELRSLATAVLEARNSLDSDHKPPLLLKISPDLTYEEKRNIASVITNPKTKMDGLIVSNTTISRPSEAVCPQINEAGGLSGEPLRELALQTIKEMAILTKGLIPIVGVGGISSGKDALACIYHGASLVQIYTTLAYHGPPIIPRVLRELNELLKNVGYKSVEEAVGSKLPKSTHPWWGWW